VTLDLVDLKKSKLLKQRWLCPLVYEFQILNQTRTPLLVLAWGRFVDNSYDEWCWNLSGLIYRCAFAWYSLDDFVHKLRVTHSKQTSTARSAVWVFACFYVFPKTNYTSLVQKKILKGDSLIEIYHLNMYIDVECGFWKPIETNSFVMNI